MKSKLALFLATLLFFNIILPTKVFAASVQDQSKPIFGLTADQVVEKYNQLTDLQKDQVLRSLGNTSIFSNSLFGNSFNSSFGVLNDAVKKIGDLFFQANGVVYKLGSSALAWVSRLIDKVFNNDLNDLNISQPVIDDFYKNTRDLQFDNPPFWVKPNKALNLNISDAIFQNYVLPLPNPNLIYGSLTATNLTSVIYEFPLTYDGYVQGILVNLDDHQISFQEFTVNNGMFGSGFTRKVCSKVYSNGSWVVSSQENRDWFSVSFSNDYQSSLLTFLNKYFVSVPGYYIYSSGLVSYVPLEDSSELINITNNTYYNYIYNIPDQTPLNLYNIVSNTAINYDPVENLIQYLPDNYNIEQYFTVVNNYYISSGSAITGQAIDVNIVSPGVIDVRVINPEDLTQQEINNVSKDIINNYDVDINASDLTSTITVVKDTAVNNLNEVAPTSGSSIRWVKIMFLVIPSDLMKILLTFLIVGIIVCVYHSR